ncbi:MAG: helix-turn-helix transcriptional regulator [Clostridia bacterium]|nr:helix-turn-helix transcriptional regulator [Clostridia bacterium]
MAIAENIRALREDRDFTQTEIAEQLGIKQTVYSRYEREQNELPLHHLIKLCTFYNVSADYILGLPKGLDYPERL